MKNLFLFCFSLLMGNTLFAQEVDTTNVPIIPIGEKFDTLRVRALLDPKNNAALFVRDYFLITRSYIFSPESKVQPQVIEQWMQIDAPKQPKILDFKKKIIWVAVRE